MVSISGKMDGLSCGPTGQMGNLRKRTKVDVLGCQRMAGGQRMCAASSIHRSARFLKVSTDLLAACKFNDMRNTANDIIST